MKRTTSIVLVALALASCARQQEPAQATESAPREATAEKATAPVQPQPERVAPGAQPAPPPAAAGDESRAKKEDLLAPDDAKQKAPSNIEDAVSQLQATFSDLEKALALSAPDCVTAKQLRDRVCDLAEHICRLADEGAGIGAQERCGDGRGRCVDAKRRYEQVCATP
jgi:hypothetical protein